MSVAISWRGMIYIKVITVMFAPYKLYDEPADEDRPPPSRCPGTVAAEDRRCCTWHICGNPTPCPENNGTRPHARVLCDFPFACSRRDSISLISYIRVKYPAKKCFRHFSNDKKRIHVCCTS